MKQPALGISGLKRTVQLTLLALALLAAMFCRSAIGPLQEALRTALRFSDNQVAVLQGMAMALPMALGSIPIGLLADRISRARMLLFFVALAPISLALCAISPNFTLLFAARCLAGLSSATALIVSFSIVGDLYGPAQRGRASMILASGEIIGAPLSFALGGTLLVMVGNTPWMRIAGSALDDWRWALVWMGGLLIPIALLMTLLIDPPRSEIQVKQPSLRVVWPELWSYRAVALPMLLARGMVWLADGSVFVWAAPSFSRRFHLPPDKIGALMGTILLVSGLLGPAIGGPLADFCQRRGGPRRTMTVLAGIAVLSMPMALFNFMPTATSAAIMMTVFLTLGFSNATTGVTLSIIVIPGELRGLYLGMAFTVGSIFFVGLAPLAVSSLSGLLGGEAMIGKALTIVCAAASLLGATVFALSARYFPAGDQPLARL